MHFLLDLLIDIILIDQFHNFFCIISVAFILPFVNFSGKNQFGLIDYNNLSLCFISLFLFVAVR